MKNHNRQPSDRSIPHPKDYTYEIPDYKPTPPQPREEHEMDPLVRNEMIKKQLQKELDEVKKIQKDPKSEELEKQLDQMKQNY